MTPGRATAVTLTCLAVCGPLLAKSQTPALDEAYLTWSGRQVESIGEAAYRRGRVGGLFVRGC